LNGVSEDILLLSAGAAWILVLLFQYAAGKLYRKKFGKSLSSEPVREAFVGLACIGLLCLVSVPEIGFAFLCFALFSVFAAIVSGLFHFVGLGSSAAWRIVLATIGATFLAIHFIPKGEHSLASVGILFQTPFTAGIVAYIELNRWIVVRWRENKAAERASACAERTGVSEGEPKTS
jgi:hypothetical protein